MKLKKTYIIITLIAILTSCNNDDRFFPDNSNYPVRIVRFDSAVINSDTRDKLKNLYQTYPEFIGVYTENIMGVDSNDTLTVINTLEQFLNDTIYGFKHTNEVVLSTFSDITRIQEQLNTAFGKIKFLYNDIKIPDIYFIVSGFNSSLFFWQDSLTKENIAIGSDMYLGSNYEYYNRVVYNYQKQNMKPESIPIDIVSAYLFKNLPSTYTKNRLLENMIYRGKIMYVVSKIFNTASENEIMGYTKEQWNWCKKNEKFIWQRIIDKHDIFKSESLVLTSYLNDGPFTAEISQESPARLGTWIGMRIVDSYMNNNKEVSLQELISNNDAQYILEMSNYRP